MARSATRCATSSASSTPNARCKAGDRDFPVVLCYIGAAEAAPRRHYRSDAPGGSSITLEGTMRADWTVNEDEAAMDDESQLVLEVSSIAPPVRRAPRRRRRLAEI